MKQYNIDKKLLHVLENSCIPYAIYRFFDSRVEVLAVSDGLCDMFKVDRESAYDILNNHIYDRDHPEDVARLGNATLRFATQGGDFDVTYRTLISGAYRIVHARGKHVYDENGERLAVIWYSDEGPYVDDTKDLFDQAIEHAMSVSAHVSGGDFDGMTGLPNTGYFFKLAESARERLLEEGEDPVLLYFDFNDMKNYNMKFGFSEGDRLIIGMSKILVHYFSNLNCCRFSGDHFGVVTIAARLEETLLSIFEEVSKLNGGRSLPLRVGIYKNSMGNVTAGVACDRAKMACDEKRNAISSCFNYFSDKLLKSERMRHYVLDNLDKAIREKWLQVYYQPIIRSANGKVCDEEALIRWIDPVRGFMSPAEFVPVLEDAKIIYKLDLYVLERILEKYKMLSEKGLEIVPCSLNVSRSDFEVCDIVEEIRKRVDEAGIAHDMLTIEITESGIGVDVDYICKQAELLTGMGFKVWMDDYGSGYSSPEILQIIPFHTIKLDMQFMRQFNKTPKSKVVISEIINMALNLGFEIVVEGVETAEQKDFLCEVGATKLQGYYFSKPLPLDEVMKRYDKGAKIGFENPKESDYYTAIGKINLYDISLVAVDEKSTEDHYTIPMAIFEVGEDSAEVVRSNHEFIDAVKESFGVVIGNDGSTVITRGINRYAADLLGSLIRCARSGYQFIEDKMTEDGSTMHILFRKLADNQVTGKGAVAVIMMEKRKDSLENMGVTYGKIALALSSDYLYLYYVNLDTEEFIEYKPDAVNQDIVVERRGSNFFEAARKDAFYILYKDDREGFINTFSREIVMDSIKKYGSFSYSYRLPVNDKPVCVNLKATSIGEGEKHIIIGVNKYDHVPLKEQ